MVAPARRQRKPPAVRRAMIVAAARDIIAEQGMHSTTLRDIAATAEVAVGTVTYHFGSVSEVLAGVLELEMQQYSEPIMQRAGAADTGAAGLRILTDGLLADGPRATEHWRLWLDFWTLAAHQEHYAQWQSQVYRELHALTEDLFRRGARDGTVPLRAKQADLRAAGTGVDPDAAERARSDQLAHAAAQRAVEYVAMMDGLVVQAYLPNSRLSSPRARQLLWEFVIPH